MDFYKIFLKAKYHLRETHIIDFFHTKSKCTEIFYRDELAQKMPRYQIELENHIKTLHNG